MSLTSLTIVLALTSITNLEPENVSSNAGINTAFEIGNSIALDVPLTLNPNSGIAKLTGASDLGEGTSGARLATYGQILEFLPLQNFWILGAGPGTDILYEICTGIKDAPEQTTMEQNGQILFLPKCAVDSQYAASTLRDPHNWTLNIMIHHGIIGLLVFILAILGPIAAKGRQINSSLPIIAIFAYFLNGLFGVIISTPFAMLPIAVFVAWLVSPRQEIAE
jgi:O-antigen ligase